MTKTTLRLVTDTDKVKNELVKALTQALKEAKEGKIEGYSLVLVGATIKGSTRLIDRLPLIGALHMAIVGVVGEED